MRKAETILQHLRTTGKPTTARQIIDACFVIGEHQSCINSVIGDLVRDKKLIRDSGKPYTVVEKIKNCNFDERVKDKRRKLDWFIWYKHRKP